MNVFNIMGPIMIGPSSSHTAGAVRIGYIAGMLIKGTIKTADIGFFGSFAKKYVCTILVKHHDTIVSLHIVDSPSILLFLLGF